GGQLAGEPAAVLVAPQQFGGGAVGGDSDDPEVGLGVLLHIFEVFAGAGDDEVLAGQGLGVKAGGDGAQHLAGVQILRHLFFPQQAADVAAVALVPAQAVHVGGGLFHFLHKGGSQDVFHRLNLSCSAHSFRIPAPGGTIPRPPACRSGGSTRPTPRPEAWS